MDVTKSARIAELRDRQISLRGIARSQELGQIDAELREVQPALGYCRDMLRRLRKIDRGFTFAAVVKDVLGIRDDYGWEVSLDNLASFSVNELAEDYSIDRANAFAIADDEWSMGIAS